MDPSNQLRFITKRLNSTPVEDLPKTINFLASSLNKCVSVLQNAENKTGDSSVLVHRFYTRITSLLQDRSAHGRFCGAILAKAAVEYGGISVFESCDIWLRALLGCLNKSDPAEVKKIYMITITRIFSMARKYPIFQREITIPLIPSFVNTCLNLAKPIIVNGKKGPQTVASSLLNTILSCFYDVLYVHASTFRPFASRIRTVCLSMFEDVETDVSTIAIAMKLVSSLHVCAPKNGVLDEWSQMCSNVVTSAHDTANLIFRAVKEDWSSNQADRLRTLTRQDYSYQVRNQEQDRTGLGCWEGVYAGTSRLLTLLNLLQHLLTCDTVQPVEAPLGLILDLTERIVAIGRLSRLNSRRFSASFNPEVSSEERDDLLINLPRLYVSCLKLLSYLITNFRASMLPVYSCVGEQILSIFEIGQTDEEVRSAAYDTFRKLIDVNGPAVSQLDQEALIKVLGQVCKDLILSEDKIRDLNQNLSGDHKKNPVAVANTSTRELSSQSNGSESEGRIKHVNSSRMAWALLPVVLSRIPVLLIPHSMRTEIDRVSILVNHKSAMLASVMNPETDRDGNIVTASIVPFLASSDCKDISLEALLRPRMSTVASKTLHVIRDSNELPDAIMDSGSANQQSGHNVDLLSRLEHFIDDDADYGRSENGDTASGLLEPHNNLQTQQSENSIPKKRSFATMEQGTINDGNESQIENVVGVTAPKSILDAEGGMQIYLPNIVISNEATDANSLNSKDQQHAPLKLEQSSIDLKDGNMGGVADSANTMAQHPVNERDGNDDGNDDSDFEIPEINLEPDTDDDSDMVET